MFRGEDVPKDGLHKSVEKDDDDKGMGGRPGMRSRTRAGMDKLEVMERLVLRRSSGSSSRRRSASPQK